MQKTDKIIVNGDIWRHDLTVSEIEVLMFHHLDLEVPEGAYLNAVMEALIEESYLDNGSITIKGFDFIDAYNELPLQQRIFIWGKVCFKDFGLEENIQERAYRFGEEALELMQASGITKEDLHKLVEYVYNRPVGEQGQEIGGTFTTLAMLCSVNKHDMEHCANVELDRIWTRIPEIRKKHANKPKASPLPGSV